MKDMLGRSGALSVEEALNLINENLPEFRIKETKSDLVNAFGRVLSKDIYSPEDLPFFSRSTMDGYAVIASDTFGAGEKNPVYLNAFKQIVMGEMPDFELKTGEAARISTGGAIPRGADAVIMFEHVQGIDNAMIEAQRSVAPGENIILKGEDIGKGDAVLAKGKRLRPQDAALLSALGITEVYVNERPRVSIISTGDEIVPAETPLKAGLVRDSNYYHLAGLVSGEGATPVRMGIVNDEREELKAVIMKALKDTDMLIISGGSSVGVRDVTENVMSELGRILFHSVALKPGKPLLVGIIEGKFVFGLPGHPRAVAVCFNIFVRNILNKLSGLSSDKSEQFKKVVRAKLSKNINSSPGRQDVISVMLRKEGGELWAVPILGKSGLISTMVTSEGSIIVPLDRIGMERGETVDVILD